jgi:hypothetical protein
MRGMMEELNNSGGCAEAYGELNNSWQQISGLNDSGQTSTRENGRSDSTRFQNCILYFFGSRSCNGRRATCMFLFFVKCRRDARRAHLSFIIKASGSRFDLTGDMCS